LVGVLGSEIVECGMVHLPLTLTTGQGFGWPHHIK